jgi:putative nucleotidyltransferase with HDIG domain
MESPIVARARVTEDPVRAVAGDEPARARVLVAHRDDDDRRRLVAGLRAAPSPLEVVVADDPQSAAAILVEDPVDVLVASVCTLDGLEILRNAKRRRSRTARIVLTPADRHQLGFHLTGLAHQVLPHSVPGEDLAAVVESTMALRRRLADPALQEFVGGLERLPSMPDLYTEVVRLAGDPDSTLAEIGAVVAKDVAMTTKVLQLINSAFFGLRHRITDARQAVTLLGIDTIAALVLSVGVFEAIRSPRVIPVAERVQQHSWSVAAAARQIATDDRRPRHELADFQLAGMLHDIGKLLLASADPDRFAEAEAADEPLTAERELFGAAHPEVGAYLLGLWGLPDPIVEAAAYHHDPSAAAGWTAGPLAAVHVVAAVARSAPDEAPDIDAAYLSRIGILGRIDTWITAAENVLDRA